MKRPIDTEPDRARVRVRIRMSARAVDEPHGSELFISPRTVEWHLHKVFTKLDIDSRSKLRGVLTSA